MAISKIKCITIDCADTYKLGSFWAQVTGHPLAEDDKPGDPEALILLPEGPALLFIEVPDEKAGKNRLHFDLCPDTTRDAEVERLLALGATVYDDRRKDDGGGWVTMRDIEGNEFCVEPSEAEIVEIRARRAAAAAAAAE